MPQIRMTRTAKICARGVPALGVVTTVACSLFILVPDSQAFTRSVPAEYPDIQSAIGASVTGDSILVAPGTYSGHGNRDLDLRGKDVVLIGLGGPSVTTLDAGGSEIEPHRAIRALGLTTATTVEGFTLTGGYAGDGGAIKAEGRGTIRSCVIAGNHASSGGGIMLPLATSSLVVEDVTIESNQAFQGGGVQLDQGVLLMRRSIIRGNACSGDNSPVVRGGGISLSFTGTWPQATLEDCQITGNVADHGGGIGARMSRLDLVRCTVAGNFARVSGGGFYQITGWVHVYDSVVWDNGAPDGPFFYNVYTDAGGDSNFYCSIVDPDGASGGVPVGLFPGTFAATPLFCEPLFWTEAPTVAGDFHLAANSPALAENNDCGRQLGAFGQGCAAVSVPSEETPASGELMEVRSNPAPGGRLSLVLRPPTGQMAEIGVFTADGRRVASWRSDRELERGLRLDPGVYLLRANCASSREWRKVVVLP